MARHPVAEGALRALTLAPGIVPLGMLFGAYAATTGFSPGAAAGLSALVFAGTAQFAAVGLVAAGASYASAIALVALVNSRYFLMGAATLDLARRQRARWPMRVLLALGVVDETYALQAAWVKEKGPSAAGLLAVSATFWLMWTGGTLAGALLGERLPDLAPYGLDYALPGITVGLLGIFADTDGRRVRPIDKRLSSRLRALVDTHERLLAGLAALAVAGALALAGQGTLAVLVVPAAFALGLGRWGPRRAG